MMRNDLKAMVSLWVMNTTKGDIRDDIVAHILGLFLESEVRLTRTRVAAGTGKRGNGAFVTFMVQLTRSR
jgi:hypothetical protein